LTTDVDEEMQERVREYVTNPFSRYLIENAIAAHLLVHTQCRLQSRLALERAIAIYEYFLARPECIRITKPTGKYARVKDVVEVLLPTNDAGHTVRLNLGLAPSEIEELPIRLTFGSKADRRNAWDAVREVRLALLREEARRLRQQSSAKKT
jgi:hypothetical protein